MSNAKQMTAAESIGKKINKFASHFGFVEIKVSHMEEIYCGDDIQTLFFFFAKWKNCKQSTYWRVCDWWLVRDTNILFLIIKIDWIGCAERPLSRSLSLSPPLSLSLPLSCSCSCPLSHSLPPPPNSFPTPFFLHSTALRSQTINYIILSSKNWLIV